MKQLKLNLGAGYDHRSGYLNVDIDKRTKPDLVHDLRQPLPFKKNSVDEILLQDVLEHLTKEDALLLLERCARVLKTGGVFKIRVPNVFAIMNKFRWQRDLMMLYLYGDTSKNGEWGAHKYGYTPEILAQMVGTLGLTVTSSRTDDTNFEFELRKLPKDAKLEQPVVQLSSLSQLLLTWWHYAQGKKVVWELKKPLPALLTKLVLRPMSLFVDRVVISNKKTATFVTEVLRFSHLRLDYKR